MGQVFVDMIHKLEEEYPNFHYAPYPAKLVRNRYSFTQEIYDLVQPFDDRAMARSILTTLKETR